MNAPHQHVADGSLHGCRWFIERLPDMVAPQVLLTLQTWGDDGRGNLQTLRQELRLPASDQKAWLAARIDAFLIAVEAADAAKRKLRAERAMPPASA